MKNILMVLLLSVMFLFTAEICSAQTVIKEKVKLNNSTQSDPIEDWIERDIYFYEEVEPGNVLNMLVGYFNYAGEFMQIYFHPSTNAVIEFSIAEGNEYCTFVDAAGNLVPGEINVQPDGYLSVKLKLNDNFNVNGAKIKVDFAACETACVSFSAVKEGTVRKNMNKNSNLLSISCPPLIDCGIYGVPGIFHYSASAEIVYVSQDDCSDAPQCEGEVTPLQFVTKENSNGSFGMNLCPPPAEDGSVNGITAPIPKTMQQHLGDVIEPCYNSAEDRWQVNLGTLTFDLIVDLCTDNIEYNKNKFGFQYVNSVDEIPADDVCKAIKDLKDFEQYAKPLKHGAYVFYKLLWAHERTHKTDFENLYTPAFEEMNKSFKAQFKPKCSEIDNINDVKESARFVLGVIFENEYKKAEMKHNEMSGTYPKDETKKRKWEQTIHDKIKPEINDIIQQLALKNPDC